MRTFVFPISSDLALLAEVTEGLDGFAGLTFFTGDLMDFLP